jgi:cytochrome c peroxidase
MRLRLPLTLPLAALLTVAACGDAGRTGITLPSDAPPPSLAGANVAVAATVGETFTYDATRAGSTFANPAGGPLTYAIAFNGPPNGLTATGGTIEGRPTGTGIVVATITATDALGRSAGDRFAVVVFESGLASPELPTPSYRYADAEVPLPAHFVASVGGASIASFDNTPASNPITDAGATLGRVLFYDSRLSRTDATSCASCHRQSLGFADALPRSVGITGALTPRHATGLANARFYGSGRFFWDERAASLEAQVLEPIQHRDEMGMSLDSLALKLAVTPYYPALFAAAFGSPSITSDRIAAALAQFARAMVSGGSRYDRAFDAAGNADFAATLTPQEILGEQVFRRSGCPSCHVGVAQAGEALHNNGLDAAVSDTGAGRGRFKTPSLRNVAVRRRFMHDARFKSLDEVVAFYDSGVQPSPGLDALLLAPDGSPRRLGLSDVERAALVSFLGALTDSTFLTSPRFANPFARGSSAPDSGVTVTIQGNQFLPSSVVVRPGAVVSFHNIDNEWHDATFDNPAVGATPRFTSGVQTIVMPTALGAYTYHCTVHGPAMSGSVVVGR